MGKDRDQRDRLSLSDSMNQKGIELADRGWLEEAERYFRRAIELDPDAGHTWDNLASVLSEKGDLRGALAAHLEAIEREPDVAAARYNLAAFLNLYGLELAATELKEAIDLDPELPDAQLSLGLVLADLGQPEEALAALSRAVEAEPGDAYPRHELASLLLEEGDVRGAVAQLREVARLEPENYEALLDLASCYAQKGFFVEADRVYDDAEALRPGDVHVLYGRAHLYAAWNRDTDALERLAAAVAREPERVRRWIAADRIFDRLRGQPGFDALFPAPAVAGDDVD